MAVCFLLHFPWPHGRWALPITMSCGARTFLPPLRLGPIRRPQSAAAGGHPVHSDLAQPLRYTGHCRGRGRTAAGAELQNNWSAVPPNVL